jgi:hypothetical protein
MPDALVKQTLRFSDKTYREKESKEPRQPDFIVHPSPRPQFIPDYATSDPQYARAKRDGSIQEILVTPPPMPAPAEEAKPEKPAKK